MNWKRLSVMAGIVLATIWSIPARGDEASGVITDTGFNGGSFTIDDKGTTREFNLSSSKSQFEPTTWRPTKGDAVKLTFTTTQDRHGNPVLAVDKVTLVKAGPDTVAELKSPVSVEITEVGRSGVRAKIPSGQILRFGYSRGTKKLPAGWVPAVGEKASIDFHVEAGRAFNAFGISYEIDKIEKTK